MDKPFNQNSSTSNNNGKASQNLQSLEASEARTLCLLAALPQMAWLARANGEVTSFNQRWYEYTGLTLEASGGWEFLKAIHPQDRDFLQANVNPRASAFEASEWAIDHAYTDVSTNQEFRKTQNSEVECRIQGKDGTYSWFIAKKIPVIGANGQLLEWIGTFTPKTRLERHSEPNSDVLKPRLPSQLQVELAQQLSVGNQQLGKLPVRPAKHGVVELRQRRQPKRLTELSQAIIWEAEATTGQFTYVSRSAETLLGYPIEQWLQPDFWINLVHPDDRQWTVALYRQQVMRRQDYELEYRCIAADSRVVWLRDRACLVRDDQDQVSKRRGLMVDITWVKLADPELRTPICRQSVLAQLAQVQASLEKRNQEFAQLTYVLSHDLKAPLQAITSLSQWLEEDIGNQLNAGNHDKMQLLRGRVQRLETLIDGLLQYFRAERLSDKPKVIDVAALLNQVIAALMPPPQFSIEVAPNLPTLVTRQSLLEQVFSRLIHNAIQHHPNPNGKVRISAQERADVYEFAIADDGAGIAPQFQERIFAIFQTLQARDKVENTGIGLAIAKKIVEDQGGTIRVESQVGQGATFYFTWVKS